MKTKKQPAMAHITEPSKWEFQVRIVRAGEEHSRSFAHKQWGSRKKSLAAAQSWRDQMLVALSSADSYLYLRGASKRNKSTGTRGITRYETYDKRADVVYVRYGVSVKVDGKQTVKSFQAGNVETITPDDEFHALRTAIKCRNDYLEAVSKGVPFDLTAYKGWKTKRIYE